MQSYPSIVLLFLRFTGVINAAIWLGGAVYFTLGAAPAVFSTEMTKIFDQHGNYTGFIAQILLARYFMFHYFCSAIAILHWLGEWWYLGKTVEKFGLGLLLGIITLGLMGGLWFQPKLKQLYQTKTRGATNELRVRAKASFGKWHGVSQVCNLFATLGLVTYMWRVANPADAPRFVRASKFRG